MPHCALLLPSVSLHNPVYCRFLPDPYPEDRFVLSLPVFPFPEVLLKVLFPVVFFPLSPGFSVCVPQTPAEGFPLFLFRSGKPALSLQAYTDYNGYIHSG